MIQAQIYREWGVAIVKGRAECLLALLECTVPNASPRSKAACGKSRDKLIERANVAHCSGGFAEAVQLRRRYAVMKACGPRPPPMNRRRAVSPPQGLRPLVLEPNRNEHGYHRARALPAAAPTQRYTTTLRHKSKGARPSGTRARRPRR